MIIDLSPLVAAESVGAEQAAVANVRADFYTRAVPRDTLLAALQEMAAGRLFSAFGVSARILALETLAGIRDMEAERIAVTLIREFCASEDTDMVWSGIASAGLLPLSAKRELIEMIAEHTKHETSRIKRAAHAFIREAL